MYLVVYDVLRQALVDLPDAHLDIIYDIKNVNKSHLEEHSAPPVDFFKPRELINPLKFSILKFE